MFMSYGRQTQIQILHLGWGNMGGGTLDDPGLNIKKVSINTVLI